VVVKVIDAASLEGVWKALRYGVRKFPAFIVNGQARFQSGNYTGVGQEIRRVLGAAESTFH
jgi:hypothetical protein